MRPTGCKEACFRVGISTVLLLSACGGDGGSRDTPMPPPAGSYDLQTAMAALVKSGLSADVGLSGTLIVDGVSNPLTGKGVLTLAPAVSGTFAGATAQLQTETLAGTVTAAGQSAPYSSFVVNVYDAMTAIAGESQASEVDVAQSPISIPTAIGESKVILGTMSRYSDGTSSVALGTIQISVAVTFIPVDPESPEVVEFTYKVFDNDQMLVETDTFDYDLTENNVLSFNSAVTQTAKGTLTVKPD